MPAVESRGPDLIGCREDPAGFGLYGDPPATGSVNGMTVEITAVHLIARIVVEVEAGVVCQPAMSGDGIQVYWEDPYVRLWVKQASGRSVAAAYMDGNLNADDICDGLVHPIVLTASADTSSVPFKKGTAVVALSAYASYWWENWDTGESGGMSQNASTGWLVVRLGR